MALKGPERISALIVQNGNAYEEGLSEFWDPIKAYWAEKTDERRQAIAFILKLRHGQAAVHGGGAGPQPGSTPTCGSTTTRSSPAPATRTSSWICSTTTAATSRCTRNSMPSSATTSHRR